MARPIKEETAYKVTLHVNGVYRYASTCPRVITEEGMNRLYGATWFLERAAEATGIRADLEKVFEGNKEIVDDIMTLAMFPYITNFSYSRLARWQRIEKSPSKRTLAPCDITRLAQSITEKHRMELLRLRAARLGKEEMCCVDSTSRTAYGESLADIRWGTTRKASPCLRLSRW